MTSSAKNIHAPGPQGERPLDVACLQSLTRRRPKTARLRARTSCRQSGGRPTPLRHLAMSYTTLRTARALVTPSAGSGRGARCGLSASTRLQHSPSSLASLYACERRARKGEPLSYSGDHTCQTVGTHSLKWLSARTTACSTQRTNGSKKIGSTRPLLPGPRLAGGSAW